MDRNRLEEIQRIAHSHMKENNDSIVPTDLDYILDKEHIDLRLMPESYIREALLKKGHDVEGKTDGVLFYGFSITKDKHHTIVISKEMHTESERRTRFTVAHELGHYFLHFTHDESQEINTKLRSQTKEYSTSEKVEEIEANQFAAELLMPEAKIITINNLFKASLGFDELVSLIARTFDVSFSAAKMRLNSLGMG